MEIVHPGQARELVWSVECCHVELAGFAAHTRGQISSHGKSSLCR
jgi:hypothetical protein